MVRTALSIGCLLLVVPVCARPPAGFPSSFEDCDEQVRRVAESFESFRCYVLIARRSGAYDEAVNRLEGLLSASAGRSAGLARLALAQVEADRGSSRTMDLFRAAADTLNQTGNREGEVLAWLGLSRYLGVAGQESASADALAQAKRIADSTSDPALLGRIAVARSWVLYETANYGAAETALDEVEQAIVSDKAPIMLRSSWYAAKGAVLWAEGRLDSALAAYQRQRVLLRAVGDRYAEASCRYNIALVTENLGAAGKDDADMTVSRYEDALDLAVASGNRSVAAACHLALAQSDRPTKVRREHMADGIRLARDTHDIENELFGQRLLAGTLVLDEPRDRERGFRVLARATSAAREHEMPHHVARAWIERAYLEWKLQRESGATTSFREQAKTSSLAALDAIETIRDHQGTALVRARVFGRWVYAYDRFVGNLLWPPNRTPGTDDLALAFTVLERRRAQVLLDEMNSAGVTVATLRAAKGSVAAEPSTPRFVPREVPKLGELRHELKEDEALLSFQTADRVEPGGSFGGGSWVLVNTREMTWVQPLPDRSDLESRIDLWVGLVGERNGSEARGAATLYRDLLAPALEALDPTVTHLIMIPDGPLYRLPFGALRRTPDAAPITSEYDITLAPSVATWLRVRHAAASPISRLALAIVDPAPWVSGTTERVDADDDETVCESARSTEEFPALPFARLEAAALRAGVGEVQVRTGKHATESFVKHTDLARYAIIHFGVHALMNDDHPERSGIVLAPGDPAEDGRLGIREIVRLDLAGTPVVLSACRSAGGSVMMGEGAWSLTRAFLAGGARSAIGSLWSLRDEESSELFEAFYRHLGNGETLRRALTAARRERIAAGSPTAAWAGLVLVGDGDLLPFPGGSGPMIDWSWAAAIAAIVGVAAAARGCQLYLRHHRSLS